MTAFGIDLGTTNSVIAHLVDGVPRAIPVDGGLLMPSIVLYHEDGRVIVGREARNLTLLHPSRVVRSVKRYIGSKEPVDVFNKLVAPEQVSADILKALCAAARTATGEVVRDVVITVPAYFKDSQRRATLKAGELAGLEVLRLVNEPTAASLVYDRVGQGEALDASELMLVYDLGGGTFDVSVLEVSGEVREVRSTAGDAELGGDDFDQELVDRFVNDLHDQGATMLEAAALARLWHAAEATKIALSTEVEVEVREEFISEVWGKPVHLRLRVTRREFEATIEDMLKLTIELSQRAIEDAKLRKGERIARICLVGGSTRIPMIRSLLEQAFDAEIHEEIDVDLAVGLGAAIQCGMLTGVDSKRVLVDVAAHTLGVRAFGDCDKKPALNRKSDVFVPILRRNTALPAERAEELHTQSDNQPLVHVEVFQGESPRCSQNRLVGSFDYALAPAPAGTPVRFRIAYDPDGIVRVTAAQAGGEEETVTLQLPDAMGGINEIIAAVQLDTTLIGRAKRMLDGATGELRDQLSDLIDDWDDAPLELRGQVDDALMDLFLSLEAED